MHLPKVCDNLIIGHRDVAQLGSALRLGRRGRTFESCHPDHLEKNSQKVGSFFIFKIYRGVAPPLAPPFER